MPQERKMIKPTDCALAGSMQPRLSRQRGTSLMALAIGNSELTNELWQAALGTLERTFSKPVFEMWIKPMRFVSYESNELHLLAHTKFAKEWVGTKLQPQMIDVLRELFGSDLELRLS